MVHNKAQVPSMFATGLSLDMVHLGDGLKALMDLRPDLADLLEPLKVTRHRSRMV